ncbi:tetraacyldisaccharide 4'-kinase [Bacteroides helcogenes]|uniref:Tetraacyldisaccharide 4'-kinase n=1 Tax=Bacteroides helcogenes (strain ATCC 35417 / DSM 20613 / JCM 6297 / CCUG 15421 / P 36-108) TaxID=693979 RepID=E6SRL0_BACT6|nr:tetraacyldisaccharide 4'-kinase [Bacteroides helcogenes]ADV45100.1 lipid-A-disaccharide kinase [Bacteroides helcogenes P 36-108]MDY5238660.1 tetraacyldisaccharide 4'-kinase [Bacteroides helcogenes]
MEENFIKIHHWLYPLSWLYGIGVRLRNKLFDWGWLRSKSFDVPIICVGNLAVGGTGKTPHTEYLIKILQNAGMNVATLSRGYKRNSKGYILADNQSNAILIGDEPYQIKSKFPNIQVAVDEDRCHGIEQLLKLEKPVVDVILLDDAFQHRYVKPGMSILLTDFHRLLCDDSLLPAGRLREPASGKIRAQIVIVTKCPDDIKPIDFNIIAKRLHLYPYQQLYFSRFRYGTLRPLFSEKADSRKTLSSLRENEQVLLVTGIASPTSLVKEMESYTTHVKLLAFDDHHDFSHKDLQQIKGQFMQMKEGARLIITTEKDAARLKFHPALDEILKPYIYVLPIEIEFLQNQQHIFNQNITGYVRTNSRNRIFPERKDAHTS